MRGELGFVDFAGNGGGNHGGGIFIADIVLHDEHGTNPALFATHYGG